MGKENPKTKQVPVTKRSLMSWVLTSNWKLQFLLLIVILVTVCARVLPLELQKKIINEAINLKKINLLYTYCGLYLASVVVAGGLKYVINIIQTYIGQNALSEIRKALYAHILTLPISYFRKTQAGMVVSSLLTEIAPAGEFVGMAVAVPITNVLTLLAFGGYLFYLNWMMACISLAIYPLVIIIVPRLQKRTNRANKKRVDITRDMSSHIAEAITGIHEIHGNSSYVIENNKFGALVGRLLKVRILWNLYKMGTKALNNFLVNLAPFLLFLVGGWLIIEGRFDLGSLVAFISAQEKLYDPWKELMDFYQVFQDSSVRYSRTMEYFDYPPEHEVSIEGRAPYELDNGITIENLSFIVPGNIKLLNDINLTIKPGEHLALVGFSGSGKSTLALCIGQLYKYTSGSLCIGSKEVADMTKRDIVENVGFVSQSPFIFTGTIKENLLYSSLSLLDGEEGVEGENLPSLDDQIAVLQQSGIFVDVLRFGLNAVLSEEDDAELAERIIRVRESFQADFGEELADIVEFFDERTYLRHSNVATNIVFGSPNKKELNKENLLASELFMEFLNEAQLVTPLMALGTELAKSTVDILGAMPKDAILFENSPIAPGEIDHYKDIVRRLEGKRAHELDSSDRRDLLSLALGFIPGKHKTVGLSPVLENMILEARSLFKNKVQNDQPDLIAFYSIDEYIHNHTILDNILFGKSKSDAHQTQEKISQSIIQLLIQEDLLEAIVEIGMHFQVGSKGDKLSGGQRQKLAIARVLLRKPRVLIMDEATSALDNKSQARIQNILDSYWKGSSTVVAVVHRLDIVKNYDKVAVMRAGKISEHGTYEELMARKGDLYELVHGKQ